MSTEREAFEAWYAGHWAQATGKTQPLAEVAAIVVTMRDGEYYDDGDGDGARPPYINNLWRGWQARAALTPQGTAKWFEENEPMPSQDQLLREVESLREANSALAGAAIVPDGMVLVPRDLIGAACGAIRSERDASKVLAELRRYTTGDLSSPPQEQPHDE